MSVSTQTNPSNNSRSNRARAAWIAAGTAVVVVVAAVAFQFLRPREGAAGENSPETGRAAVNSGISKQPLARVNGELIAYDTVAAECMQRYGGEVLESFINRTIIHQACTGRESRSARTKFAKRSSRSPRNSTSIRRTGSA